MSVERGCSGARWRLKQGRAIPTRDGGRRMDLSAIPSLLASHAWIPLAALVVGFLVWLLKTRPALQDKIPPRVRPWVAIGLGQLLAVLQAVTLGTPWKDAVLNGLLAALTAMFGHDVGIEGIRGGKELGTASDGGDGPKPPTPLVKIVGGAFLLLLVSCAGSDPNATSPVRHWEVRGAILTMKAGNDAAAVACNELPTDSAQTTACFAALDRALTAEKKAVVMLQAWEIYKAPLRCAASEWADALVDDAQVFLAAGLKVPVEVEDAIAAAHVIDRIADAGCPLIDPDAGVDAPTDVPALAAPPSSSVVLDAAIAGD